MKVSKVYKTLNIFIRLIIVVSSLGFICWKIFAGGDITKVMYSIQSYGSNPFFLKGLLVICVLMILNWSIETIKWQFLIHRIEHLSFLRAFQSVLTGITVSIFTPNRTGEFIGRAFILKNSDPVKAVLLTLVGSLSQLIVTIVLGTIAFVVSYRDYLPMGYSLPVWAHLGLISGIVVFNLAVLSFFLKVPMLTSSMKEMVKQRVPRLMTYLQVIGTISRNELFGLLSLSALRYLVFSLQFFLILIVFGIEIPVGTALYVIPLIYLALAVIPTFALTELGVRGSVSLYFIGIYFLTSRGIPLNEKESLAVVLAAGMLWIINLALPAIFGVPFVFKLRFFRR